MGQEPPDASLDRLPAGQGLLPEGPSPTIVAIDDDAMVLTMITRTLRAAGMVCHTAATGAAGLQLIRERQPDLVLLDIVMVEEDGFSVCREIRRTWSPVQLPVVMVTGLEDLGSIQAAYLAGANDYLTKPLHWKHLAYRIRHVLQANRAFKALQDSTKTLRTLFSVHPDSILTIGGDGAVTLVHSGIHSADNDFHPPLGRLDELLPRELAAQVRECCRAALDAPAQVFSLETCLPIGNEPRFWEARFIASAEDQALVMVRDITERKRAEQALHESEERYQRITAAITDYIYNVRFDASGARTTHGPGCLAVTGYRPEEFAQDPILWIRMVAEEDRPGVQEQVRRILAGEDPPPIEHRIHHKDGMERWVRNTFVPHFDEQGALAAYDGLVQDITGQKQAEFERRRLQEERQHSEKLESLGSLAGGMAHDMNNVLAAIMGMASALRSACPDLDPRARPLDSILHASGRGRDLVKALTEFTRKGLEQPHWVDLNELLRNEVELLSHARRPQVRLMLDLDPALPMVMGDASALGSTIMNLGINALDAMPGGGTLSFRTRAATAAVEILVADTGQGMAPEVLARAMEPFFTTKPVGQGTGLGLARVYGTVKAHGGSVELRSAPGQGTTVRIQLPTSPEAPRPQAAPAGGQAVDESSGRYVLLVDDDDLIQGSTLALLDVLGHTTLAVSSGEEALARIEAGYQPDIVLLDMNMPGLGGAGTLPRLRALRPALPVLLATGRADQTARDLVAAHPKVALLSKPFGIRELRDQLDALWRG